MQVYEVQERCEVSCWRGFRFLEKSERYEFVCWATDDTPQTAVLRLPGVPDTEFEVRGFHRKPLKLVEVAL